MDFETKMKLTNQFRIEKKVVKTKITKSENKLSKLLNSTEDSVDLIKCEYKNYRELHKTARTVLKELQILYVDEDMELNKLIDEENEVQFHFEQTSDFVKSYLEGKELEMTNYSIIFSKQQDECKHTEFDAQIQISSTPERKFSGFTDEPGISNQPQTIQGLQHIDPPATYAQQIPPGLSASTAFKSALETSFQKSQPTPEIKPLPQQPEIEDAQQQINFDYQGRPTFAQPQYQPRLENLQHQNYNPHQIFNPSGYQYPYTHQPIKYTPYYPYPPVQFPFAPMMLKPLEINSFDGSYDNWETFKDTFEAMIHNMPMTSIEKFHRLQQLLTGTAASFIKNVPISESNYHQVWKDIKEYYDNPRRIIHAHVHNLINLKPVANQLPLELRNVCDTFKNHLRALKSAGQDENAELFKTELLLSKLDEETKTKWEAKMANVKIIPKLEDLYALIEKRIRTLEVTRFSTTHQTMKKDVKSIANLSKPVRQIAYTASPKIESCHLCERSHSSYRCPTLKEATDVERLNLVTERKLCFNCLRPNHFASNCQAGYCREKECNRKHHTMLHKSFENTKSYKETCLSSFSNMASLKDTILATATVIVYDSNNYPHLARAMLDPGSQRNFITNELSHKLNLNSKDETVEILGIGGNLNLLEHAVYVSIKSRVSKYRINITCSLMNTITQNLPQKSFEITNWKIPSNLQLADPAFNKASKIDLLLSAAVFFDALESGILHLGPDKPKVVNSQFGWLIGGGNLYNQITPARVPCNVAVNKELENQLQRFWEIESYPDSKFIRSKEDIECESIFIQHCRRIEQRFVVQLPFKMDPKCLGDNNRKRAEACWLSIEKKFTRDDRIKPLYIEFMKTYLQLKHMEEATPNEISYYIPHHHVFKDGTVESKFRVVFNASSKTANGISLNDTLMAGPCIQDDLISIIIRFRTHQIALIGDIEKMYRQILVDESQQKYQGIIFREDASLPLKTYKLKTLTYGTTPAAFLATRCIKEASKYGKQENPMVITAVENDFYVDDLLTGADTVNAAIELRDGIQKMLDNSKLPMRKWMSNNKLVMKSIPNQLRAIDDDLNLCADETIKTLGMYWNPHNDIFQFKLTEFESISTKRKILSDIAKLFDPLGLIAPVIARAKHFMQLLWKEQLDWDQIIPENLERMWNEFKQSLKIVIDIRVDRKIMKPNNPIDLQLFGFSDACEKGYGGCVYLVCQYDDSTVSSNLICAKSKVAPLRTQSIPKLELCGATLLAELIINVKKMLNLPVSSVQCFTDSKIVLAWINKEPSTWKVFVANRITKIIELVAPENWFHITSKQNPADILSRGCDPQTLIYDNLWWQGPITEINSRLNKQTNEFEVNLNDFENDLVEQEKKTVLIVQAAMSSTPIFIDVLLKKIDKLSTIMRIIAFIMRFVNNSQKRPKIIGPISYKELLNAQVIIARFSQQHHFKVEIEAVKSGQPICTNSKLSPLNPVWDEKLQLLRVGGRLHKSNLSDSRKHPIILPTDEFTHKLFIMHHHELLHAGPQLLLNHIRHKWWPLNGKRLAAKIVSRCITCFKVKPLLSTQLMGNYPSSRLQPSKPFLNSGIDFAGPIKTLLNIAPRCRTTQDTYFCLFVCCVTKAVHIETVSSLTTDAFIAALRRFVSRRGKIRNIYSDNGTNFVGANNQLLHLMRQQDVSESLQHEFSHITWHFIPASSPHMGGIWEANIKAAKSHLYRIMGTNILNFEQFTTLLTQIEACLNSRPICVLPSQPEEILALTPGHFLTGDSLMSVPDEDYTEINANRLNKWCLIQRMFQDFWKIWHNEYIHTLQTRYKWKQVSNNLQVNDVVLVKEDRVKPLFWKLGRVTQVFSDQIGQVRFVELKINGHTTRRTIHKLCKLPLNDEN